jgi:hypothetical protein
MVANKTATMNDARIVAGRLNDGMTAFIGFTSWMNPNQKTQGG